MKRETIQNRNRIATAGTKGRGKSFHPHGIPLRSSLRFSFSRASSLLLLLATVSIIGCHKKEKESEFPPLNPFQEPGLYAGSYRIEPGAFDEILTIAPAGHVVYRSKKSETPREGSFQIDRKSLRVFLRGEKSGGPTGIFLLSGYDPVEWKGIWRGNVRFLKRTTPVPSTKKAEQQ